MPRHTKIQQVTPQRVWPSGDARPIAVLDLGPDDLEQRFGLTFEEGFDDLDNYRLAALALDDGSQAWLLRHQGNPEPGTVIFADAAADAIATRRLVLGILDLDDRHVTWRPDDAISAVPESTFSSEHQL
jgi:hypothetical protein